MMRLGGQDFFNWVKDDAIVDDAREGGQDFFNWVRGLLHFFVIRYDGWEVVVVYNAAVWDT